MIQNEIDINITRRLKFKRLVDMTKFPKVISKEIVHLKVLEFQYEYTRQNVLWYCKKKTKQKLRNFI